LAPEVTIRYKATIAYDGTDFMGFQIQPNQRTVQGELEQVLATIAQDQFIRIHPAGRTDTGVHASGMIIHFDFPNPIATDGLFRAMNALVPDDIVIKHLEIVSDAFHARYHAKAKKYTYRIFNKKLPDPFIRNFVLHHPYRMDKTRVEKALKALVGEHDFTSFCSQKTDKENKIRIIYEASVEVNEQTNEWIFTFIGNGFLYNMIRIIMGTILEIADGLHAGLFHQC
jgi:tRNA pseudouridine38-40 synthase